MTTLWTINGCEAGPGQGIPPYWVVIYCKRTLLVSWIISALHSPPIPREELKYLYSSRDCPKCQDAGPSLPWRYPRTMLCCQMTHRQTHREDIQLDIVDQNLFSIRQLLYSIQLFIILLPWEKLYIIFIRDIYSAIYNKSYNHIL